MDNPATEFFAEFEGLLGLIRSRVEYVAKFREFLDQRPVLVVVESENVRTAAAATSVFVPLPKVSDEFRVFVSTLGAEQGDGGLFRHSEVTGVGGVGHG